MADLKHGMIWLVLLFSGCGTHMPYLVSPPAPHPVDKSIGLVGKFTTSEGKEVDLANASDLPTVVIFGQDTCSACSHETEAMKASLKNAAQDPSHIHLYTLLVGAIIDDASDWKDLHEVPWTVGIDPKSELFKQYCPEQQVPCEIVFMPKKGIVLTKTGPATVDELRALTGPWED